MTSSTSIPPSAGRLNPNSLEYCEAKLKHTDHYAEGKEIPSASDFTFRHEDTGYDIVNRLQTAKSDIGDHSLYDICVSNFHSRQGANSDYERLFQQSLHPLEHRLNCVSKTPKRSINVGLVLKDELTTIRNEAVRLHNRATLQSMYPEQYPMESPVVYVALQKAAESMALLNSTISKQTEYCFDVGSGETCVQGSLLQAIDVLSTPTGAECSPFGVNDECSPAKLGRAPPAPPANLQVLEQLIDQIDRTLTQAEQAANDPGL